MKLRQVAMAVAVACSAALIVGYSFGQHAVPKRLGSSLASSFSNYSCSASGATATRVFSLAGLASNTATNDTGIIQGMINRASLAGGGVVALPAGTFTMDGHLILKNNVKLTGVGPATVLKAGPGFLDSMGPYGGYPVVTTAGASNVTVANLTADQSGNLLDANARSKSRLSAFLIDVRNSRNVIVQNVYTRNPFTYSIAVVGSTNFCVSHCNTRVASSGRYYGLDGIHVLDSNTGQVIGNYVDQRIGTDGDDGLVAHTIDSSVYDVLYSNNTVRGGNDGDGMQLAVGKYPIYNITIRNNDFWGSPFGIRTGYWSTDADGSVHNVLISANYIHDLVPGRAFPDGGNAIDIGGFGAIRPVTHITVTDNRICKAGIITVLKGASNVVDHNVFCS